MKAGAVLKKVSTYLALSALVVAVFFVWNAREEVSVSQVDVHVNSLSGDNFMDEKDVQNLVYTRIDTLLGLPVGRLRLREVESLVEGEPVVKNAEVYVGNNGVVHLEVELKKVVARIKPDSSVGFYVDDVGKVMPWVAKYSPRVLTVSGHLSKYHWYQVDTVRDSLPGHTKLIEDVYRMASYVDTSAFWRAQIGQVYIAENGDAVLVPLVGDHEIILGDLADFETKLQKLNRFYKEIVPKVGWDKYKTVNLKFDGQIVCK